MKKRFLHSVRKTHRAVVVEENKPFCGVGAQIAATLQEKIFDELDAPVGRVTSLDAPAIYSPPLEKRQLPDAAARHRESPRYLLTFCFLCLSPLKCRNSVTP